MLLATHRFCGVVPALLLRAADVVLERGDALVELVELLQRAPALACQDGIRLLLLDAGDARLLPAAGGLLHGALALLAEVLRLALLRGDHPVPVAADLVVPVGDHPLQVLDVLVLLGQLVLHAFQPASVAHDLLLHELRRRVQHGVHSPCRRLHLRRESAHAARGLRELEVRVAQLRAQAVRVALGRLGLLPQDLQLHLFGSHFLGKAGQLGGRHRSSLRRS
mmetsp:Transcript_36221/g.94630  ORF Transcript_36221/g.94630 Transcript_36221/m.94630 type:complete len:222 (+) Transcript_36221:698-1363(+)